MNYELLGLGHDSFNYGNRCKYKDANGLDQEVWFFGQEECDPDDTIQYQNGNRGNLLSSGVAAIVKEKTGGPTVFVLANARKARLVHARALLVEDFCSKELMQATCNEQWQEDLRRILSRIMMMPEDIEECLRKANKGVVESKRLPHPVRETIVDFLSESKRSRGKETAKVGQCCFAGLSSGGGGS